MDKYRFFDRIRNVWVCKWWELFDSLVSVLTLSMLNPTKSFDCIASKIKTKLTKDIENEKERG